MPSDERDEAVTPEERAYDLWFHKLSLRVVHRSPGINPGINSLNAEGTIRIIAAAIRAAEERAVAEETNRCAKVCDSQMKWHRDSVRASQDEDSKRSSSTMYFGARQCGDAIRRAIPR